MAFNLPISSNGVIGGVPGLIPPILLISLTGSILELLSSSCFASSAVTLLSTVSTFFAPFDPNIKTTNAISISTIPPVINNPGN